MNNRTMKRYAPIFLLPTMIAFAIGFIAPFILGVYLSFCEFTTVTDAKFVIVDLLFTFVSTETRMYISALSGLDTVLRALSTIDIVVLF